MKKLKLKVKDYVISTATILLIALGVLLFFTGTLDSCSRKRAEAVVEAVNESQLRIHLIDSLQQVSSKREFVKIDSVKKVSSKVIKGLKTEIVGLKEKIGSQLVDYHKDTASQSPKCDSLIQTYTQVVDSLDKEIKEYDVLNLTLKQEVVETNKLLSTSNQARDVANKNVADLKAELNKKLNWWGRNEKWVYFGSGVVGTIGILGTIATILK